MARRTLQALVAATSTLLLLSSPAVADSPPDQVPIHASDQEYLEACPEYTHYSAFPQCRTFKSETIETVINQVTSRMKDPDLARLFENAFPSTTDTTIKFHTTGNDGKAKPLDADHGGGVKWKGPHTFVITGDILAMWARDSTASLAILHPLAKHDPAIHQLLLGAINTQSEYMIESPYCNAFQPPPISGLSPASNGQDDTVHPLYEPSKVFECKYEIDSLAHFLSLANDFHNHTGSTEFLTSRWYLALENVLAVLQQQSRSTFDPETGRFRRNQYTFSRTTQLGTETLNLNGVGNPLNSGTGLVRSAFRPSDDATILGFFIPGNAMMAVELARTAKILRSADQESLAQKLDGWSQSITEGIWKHGVVNHAKYGRVFAYEVDGYGSTILMDDANVPSLLAMPMMGFVDVSDDTYQNTRKMILDRSSNPYYLTGKDFHGIGGPHIGVENAWPMSLLLQAQTSSDDAEIQDCLSYVLKSSKLGLVHESIDVNRISSYTRSWFAWANGVFRWTILDLAKRKPHLVFKDGESYEIY